ncbi:hypothetical protein D3C87_466250 [compost metagenome]
MTEAERLLSASEDVIAEQSTRRERLDSDCTRYTMKDDSFILCWKFSNRSAFSRNGWHLKSN